MAPVPKVLVVDDDPAIYRLVERILRGGFDVHHAEAAEKALRWVRERDWCLVILDIGLPGTNGLELLREVRRIRPDQACLMLTASHDMEAAKRALDEGARAYVTKPFHNTDLQATVALLLKPPSGHGEGSGRPWRVSPAP